MTSEIFFLFSRCDAAATVNHPPPHSGETWGISHKAKAKPNNDNALHTGEIFLSLIPTKIRIIPHIKETKKHLVQTHSTTVLCLQLFQQEMHSHSPSGTFFISIPTHAKWYHLTLQCKLSHPITFSSQFGHPHGQKMSYAESSSDSIKCIRIRQGTKMY